MRHHWGFLKQEMAAWHIQIWFPFISGFFLMPSEWHSQLYGCKCEPWGAEFPVEGMHCVTSYINMVNLCERFFSPAWFISEYHWIPKAIFHGCQEVNSRNSRVICRLAPDADRELPACSSCSNSSRGLCPVVFGFMLTRHKHKGCKRLLDQIRALISLIVDVNSTNAKKSLATEI